MKIFLLEHNGSMKLILSTLLVLGTYTNAQAGVLEKTKEYDSKLDYLKETYRGRWWIDVDKHVIRHYGPNGEIERETRGDYSGESRPESVRLKLFGDRSHVLLERTTYVAPEGWSTKWEIYAADGSTVAVQWNYPGELWPSPDGTYMVALSYAGEGYNDGRLRLFNLDGSLRKDVRVFDWGGSSSRVVISDDGNYGVMLQMGAKFIPERGGISSADEYGAIAIFDRQGNILGRYEQTNWRPVGPSDSDGIPHVRILSQRQRVVLIEGNEDSAISCFDFDAKHLWTVPAISPPLSWCAEDISASDSKILVLTLCEDDTSLKVIDEGTGKFLIEQSIDIGRGPVSRPGRPVPNHLQPKFKFLKMGQRAVLVYTNAKQKGDASNRKYGAIVFDFNGTTMDKITFDEPTEVVDKDTEDSFVIQQDTKVRKWRLISR